MIPITNSPLSPRAGFVFLFVFAVMMGLAIAVPRALSFLPALAGVGGVLYVAFTARAFPAIDKKLFAFLLAMSALAIASTLWSTHPDYAMGKALKSAALLLCCALLLSVTNLLNELTKHKDKILQGLLIFCGMAGLFLAMEYMLHFPVAKLLGGLATDPDIKSGYLYNRSMVFLTLLCLPCLLALYLSDFEARHKKILAAFVLISVGAALFFTESQTAQIAALIAFLMLLYPSYKKIMRRVLAGVLVVLVLAAPFIVTPFHRLFSDGTIEFTNHGFLREASIPHRLEVWNFVSEKIHEKSLTGHGIEATRFFVAEEILPLMQTKNVLHPHNAVLQIWVEFGLLGAAFVIAFLLHLFCRIEKMPPLLQRYNLMLLVTVISVTSMGYGLWQAWQIGMIFAVVAMGNMATRLYPLKQS